MAFVVRRVALAASVVIAVSFVGFSAFGSGLDPTYPLALGSDQTKRHELQQQFHLKDPIVERYWFWVRDLVEHRSFGHTVMCCATGNNFRDTTSTAIGPAIWNAALVTAQLVLTSAVFTVLASLGFGAACARWPGSWLDVLLRTLGYLGWSIPAFLIGSLAIRWLGPTGLFLGGPPGGGLVPWIQKMSLPVVTVSLGLVGLYMRYVRASLRTELDEPYTTVARSKGLPERTVLRHALRNAAIPLVAVVTVDLGAVVGITLVADFLFGMGGFASLLLLALGNADPFELTAIVVVLAGVVSVLMAVGDFLVAWLDPRIGFA